MTTATTTTTNPNSPQSRPDGPFVTLQEIPEQKLELPMNGKTYRITRLRQRRGGKTGEWVNVDLSKLTNAEKLSLVNSATRTAALFDRLNRSPKELKQAHKLTLHFNQGYEMPSSVPHFFGFGKYAPGPSKLQGITYKSTPDSQKKTFKVELEKYDLADQSQILQITDPLTLTINQFASQQSSASSLKKLNAASPNNTAPSPANAPLSQRDSNQTRVTPVVTSADDDDETLEKKTKRSPAPQKNVRAPANARFKRVPCERVGMTCFVNTALQTMAHLTPLRLLFDANRNTLTKQPGETDDNLRKRKIVQQKGSTIINAILDGSTATRLEEFIQAVNDATGKKQGDPDFIDTKRAGDAKNLLGIIQGILTSSKFIYGGFNASALNRRDQMITALRQQQARSDDFPPMLRFINQGNQHYPNEAYNMRDTIQLQGIGTYRLEAVIYSSNMNSDGSVSTSGVGHCMPIVRSGENTFALVDDLNQRQVRSESKEEVLERLNSKQGWQVAYYVKVDQQ